MKKNSAMLTPFGITKDNQLHSGMVYINPGQDLAGRPVNNFPLYVRIKSYIYTCALADDIPLEKIGMNKKMRELLRVTLAERIEVQIYEGPTDPFLEELEMQLELGIVAQNQPVVEIDDTILADAIKKLHLYKYFREAQSVVLPFNGVLLVATASKIKPSDKNSRLGAETKLTFVSKGNQKLKLKSQKQKTMAIFQSNFKIEEMGIGGLDAELTNIFRRAFASRRFPPSVIEKFGIKHVKGILLYGPPGTGKTLIAKQLAKCLKAKELKIVNGPEIFSKFVGESEENVRKLFIGAREDEKKYGDESPLHIIVFDQIDAICKQRGTVNNGTNAPDLVVNQLLTNIDGVEALNNVIVIGMTNRKDLIDEAVLRPGRFEVHIEVGLPNEFGRSQIFKIQTKTLKTNGLLGASVDLDELANLAKNFTGAEIEGLVKSASSYAMQRSSNLNDFGAKLVIKENFKVEREDFIRALDEIKPQFGVDEEKFEVFRRGMLLNYGPRFSRILNLLNGALNVCLNGEMQLNSVLLEGKAGTGKTSIASHFAKMCKFSYVKFVGPEQFITGGEQYKITQILKIFEDAYRCKEACIIVDNIERLLEFIDLGPRFSNDVLQTLLILLKRLPKKPECKLLIIGTTSCMMKLYDMGLPQAFNIRINVPQLNEKEIEEVLAKELKLNPALAKQVSSIYKKIPVRKLLQAADLAAGKDITAWKEYFDEFADQ